MHRNIEIISSLSILLFVVLNHSMTSAETVVINDTGRGWYGPAGQHIPGNDNYFAGDARGTGCGICDNDFRNFFVFDLSGVTQPIRSATLALSMPIRQTGEYLSVDSSEDYELHDVTTSIGNLLDGTGGVDAHADLGDGVVYGSRAMTAADMGAVVEIELNLWAIAPLNSTHGLFGIGGSITTLDNQPNNEAIFGWSGNNLTDITQLRLTLVPKPSCAFLIASAAMIFGTRRWRIHERD